MDFSAWWNSCWPTWDWVSAQLFCAMVALLFAAICRTGQKKDWVQKQYLAAAVVGVYLILVFMSTVFTRKVSADYRAEWMPFWSYRRVIMEQDIGMLAEIVLNCLMLFPYGLLMPVVLGDEDGRKRNRQIVFIGFLMSAAIELLQLVLKRGLFEWDDILHNTLGAAIGCGLYPFLCRWIAAQKSRSEGS